MCLGRCSVHRLPPEAPSCCKQSGITLCQSHVPSGGGCALSEYALQDGRADGIAWADQGHMAGWFMTFTRCGSELSAHHLQMFRPNAVSRQGQFAA